MSLNTLNYLVLDLATSNKLGSQQSYINAMNHYALMYDIAEDEVDAFHINLQKPQTFSA